MTATKSIGRLAASVVLALAPLAVRAADVSGTWTASFETQIGTQNYTYEFSVKGTEVTGMAKSDMGEVEISEGTTDGDTITFVENVSFQGMPLRISYTGKMTSADEIAFTRNVADLAMEELVAKRVK
jgi:hypothetical protein